MGLGGVKRGGDMRKAAIILALCMFYSVAHADENGYNIWKVATRGEKYAFVLGCISQTTTFCVHLSKQMACEIGVNYEEFFASCLKTNGAAKATVPQLVDEIDKFYTIKANRGSSLGYAYDFAEAHFRKRK
jgi:hypothetical protein